MELPFFSRLYFKFLIPMIFVSILPLLLLGIGIAQMDRQVMVQQSEGELTTIASMVKNEVHLTLDELLRDSQLMAALPGIVLMDREFQANVLQQLYLNENQLSYIEVLNLQGQLINSTHVQHRPIVQTEAFEAAALRGQQSWAISQDPTNQQRYLIIYTPIRGMDHRIIGILSGSVNLQDLASVVEKVNSPDSRAMVIDSSGRIILHPEHDLIIRAVTGPWMERLNNAQLVGNGTTSYLIDYEKYNVGFATLIEYNWIVLVERPTSMVIGQAQRAYTLTLIAIVLTSLLIFTALLWLVKRLTRPIHQLSLTFKALEAGDSSAPLPHYPSKVDEIGSLITAFGTMRSSLSKQTEKLLVSQEKYKSLFETVGDAIFIYDPKTFEILEANDATSRIYGYSKEELIGMSCLKFSAEVDKSKEASKVANEKGAIAIPHRHHKRKDGSDLYIQISVYKTQVRDQQVMFAVSSDITQRIKAEEEKNQLQEQLNQIQKLESIGQLAGGIAHDFNNQLAGIMGYAEMLNPKLDDETLIHYANKIRQGVQNGAKLTQQLLSFARKGQYSLEIMDLHDILNETKDILSRTIDKRIEIIQARNVPSPTIRGDRHQIQNAILNIALNARDAIQGSGTITLESNLIDLDKKYKDHPVDLQAGKYIALTIKDDGMGMDAAVQKHIFEPFFTTKEFGKGTGMGLPAAYGTVRHHGGDLFVDSAPQRGSVFHILLPYTEEEYKKQPKGLEPIVMAVKDSRILIVDDDESIRDLLSKLLKNIGYRVYQAEDGKKGLTTYLDNREEIDLIILDMIMPNQGGEELYYSLQKINPKVKFILSSGYSNKDNSISNIVDQGTPFIQKPYSLGKLSKVVAEILGKE